MKTPSASLCLVLGFIEDFIAERHFPPTRAEISEAFGWSSPNSAQSAMNRLKRHGLIDFQPRKARSIVITSRKP